MASDASALGLAATSALLGIGGALAAWSYQLYTYAKHGMWFGYSVIDLARQFHGGAWFTYPSDWIGIYKILDATNAGLAIFMIGIGLATLIISGADAK
ncbi:hypothetical protein [Polaromonas sp. JS666]|uniref:hypothetical protein n=1 Tax=Polaromonas sp. (strain JS666 / ATCC BAA-500) TaxID=296591 RepID=UPI000944EA23|nr:hypothetical protein [Polaromonas sp. JS666]